MDNINTKIKAKTLKQLKALKDSKFIDNKFYYYIWYTFNSPFYQQTDDIAMGRQASSTTKEIYIQTH